jgi:hypothetical protein
MMPMKVQFTSSIVEDAKIEIKEVELERVPAKERDVHAVLMKRTSDPPRVATKE